MIAGLAPSCLERACDQVADGHDDAAGRRIEEEVVARGDDDDEHDERIEGARDPERPAARVRGDRYAHDQRVSEVQRRHGGDGVVHAAEEVRAQIQVGAVRDRVDEAEAGEARRRGRIEDVDGERNRRADDHRVADQREPVAVLPVHPEEEADRDAEVKRHVGDAQHRRQRGNGVRRVLQGALAEDVQVALERDDRVRVLAGQTQRRVAAAADELVDAVEGEEGGALHQAPMGGGDEASEGVGAEGSHVHENEARPRVHSSQCGCHYSRTAAGRTRAV